MIVSGKTANQLNTAEKLSLGVLESDRCQVTKAAQTTFAGTDSDCAKEIPPSGSTSELDLEAKYPEGGLGAWPVVFGSWCPFHPLPLSFFSG